MPAVGSKEIYRKLSSQIESQFSEFIRGEGPQFVSFIKAYFEYMEQTNNALDSSRGLFDNTDIDRTLDDFVEYFQREFMNTIPRDLAVNKRLLIKHIQQLYRARGSQESYRFLFRAMFNSEIDFYYPGDDILRASDGRWVKEVVITGTAHTGNPYTMDGRLVTGQSSGASAYVTEVLQISALGLVLYQLRLQGVQGTFTGSELISDGFGNIVRANNTAGELSAANIIEGGAFHRSGDSVSLSGTSSGTATGTITSTSETTAMTFRIVNGGSGYRKANSTITMSGGGPTRTARISIVNISNTQSININQDVINGVRNVLLNRGSTFSTGSTNSTTLSANLASANITSTISSGLKFSNITVGSINTIALIDPGFGYTSKPTVTVIDLDVATQQVVDNDKGGRKGENAVIVSNTASGSMTEISILTSDSSFALNDSVSVINNSRSSANTTDTSTDIKANLTRGLIRKGVFDANVAPVILSVKTLPGRYIDTRGFLSWNNKLQDNEYYQEFSYVIRAKEIVNDYRNAVKKILHPAGTKMFGIVDINSTADLSSFASVDTIATDAILNVEISAIPDLYESVLASDLIVGGIIHNGSIGPETITSIDNTNATNTAVASNSESITSTDQVVGANETSASNSESITSIDDTDATNTAVASNSESITSIDDTDATNTAAAAVLELNGILLTWENIVESGFDSQVIADVLAGVLSIDDTTDATIT